MRRLRRDQSGAAMVEAALVLPVIAFIALGIIAFAQVLFAYQHLTGATRTAARYATKLDYDPTRQPNTADQRPKTWEVQSVTAGAVDQAPDRPMTCNVPEGGSNCPDVSVAVYRNNAQVSTENFDGQPGDRVRLSATTDIDKGPYRMVAGLVNSFAGFFGGGPVLDPSLRLHSRAIAVYE